MSGPLAGLRVLDLSRVLAGPWCTQLLGDMGADVIKIERPKAGDDTRQFGPPWFRSEDPARAHESGYFLSANRNKRSVTVDISCADGQSVIRRIGAVSDVVVENFKTGDLARKGLGYEHLSAVNPRLIFCSITGFGTTGQQAEEPGYDYLIQAQGGLMSLTGLPDGTPGAGPLRVGLAVSDLTTGMNAAIAILAALHARSQTGQGQWIDMSMLDVQVSWLANQAQAYFATGAIPPRTGDVHLSIVPYQPFTTRDGQLIITVGNDAQFRRLCDVLGCPEVGTDQRFHTNGARVANRETLIPMLSTRIANWLSHDLQQRLREAQIPSGPIQTLDQVFADPQVLARGMVVNQTHSSLGPIRTVASPAKFSQTPIEYRLAPPLLGEHTNEVLREVIGMPAAEVDGLRARGVI